MKSVKYFLIYRPRKFEKFRFRKNKFEFHYKTAELFSWDVKVNIIS